MDVERLPILLKCSPQKHVTRSNLVWIPIEQISKMLIHQHQQTNNWKGEM